MVHDKQKQGQHHHRQKTKVKFQSPFSIHNLRKTKQNLNIAGHELNKTCTQCAMQVLTGYKLGNTATFPKRQCTVKY